MLSVQRALIVGGGIAGMSCAIRLRTLGIAVHLIDKDPQWRVYGAGITVTGPTLRAFRRLGILEDVRELGFCSSSVRLLTQAGDPLGELPVEALEPGIPATGGIMRPVLHKLLSSRTKAAGVEVRLGLTIERVEDENPRRGARVHFSDGSTRDYDLVIGADGANSQVRALIFSDAPHPKYSGQGSWRVVASRPDSVDRAEIYFGGPHKVGLNPVSRTQLYMFLLNTAPGNPYIAPLEQEQVLRNLMEGYGGRIADIRAQLGAHSSIVYRPLEPLLVPRPWYRHRTLLIGDAAHATTPHLASGAGIAVEDALVLSEELESEEPIENVLERFMQRRWERCRLVVENSVRIGQLEMRGGDPLEQQQLLGESMAALGAPI